MKHASTDASYAISSKWVKLQHEKKPVFNLLCIHSVGVEQTWNLLRFSFRKNTLFTEKKTLVEITLVAITDSSDVQCLDLYLINTFAKSTRAEKCRHYTQTDTLLFICYCGTTAWHKRVTYFSCLGITLSEIVSVLKQSLTDCGKNIPILKLLDLHKINMC